MDPEFKLDIPDPRASPSAAKLDSDSIAAEPELPPLTWKGLVKTAWEDPPTNQADVERGIASLPLIPDEEHANVIHLCFKIMAKSLQPTEAQKKAGAKNTITKKQQSCWVNVRYTQLSTAQRLRLTAADLHLLGSFEAVQNFQGDGFDPLSIDNPLTLAGINLISLVHGKNTSYEQPYANIIMWAQRTTSRGLTQTNLAESDPDKYKKLLKILRISDTSYC